MLDFRSIACSLANDREALRGIRSTLRERMAAYVVPVITVHRNFAKLCAGLSFAIVRACAAQSRDSCSACSKNGIPPVIDAVTQAASSGLVST
jgi:hypothetical protein